LLSREEVEKRYSHFLVDAGDLVIASSGVSFDDDGLLRTRGVFVQPSHLPLCLNTSTIRFKSKGEADLRYLRFWLDSYEFRSQITRRVTGSAQQNFGPSHLEDIRISLPDLPEQQRIAGKLEQADGLRRMRRYALQMCDEFLPAAFLEIFGDPLEAPSELIVRFNDVLDLQPQNGLYAPADRYTSFDDKRGTEVVHMSDLFGGMVELGGLKRVLLNKSEINKYRLHEDDILIARRSINYEGAAQPCRVPSSLHPLAFESSIIRVRPDTKRVLPIYLYYYLMNPDVREKRVRPYVTISTISGINQDGLSRIDVVVPPLALQQRFAKLVAQHERLRTVHVEALRQADHLFQTLLHQVFSPQQ
jgi:type I restriction enzyme S subunit